MVTSLLAALLLSHSSATPRVKEGFVQVPGGKVWYRLVGSGPKTPLILLHGGPGIPHNYLNSMEPLSQDRPVLFYDQLGCGKSERPDNPKLWTIERACQELEAVRSALGLKKCILYGHSWGTMLATEAVLRGAKGVQALILAGPAMSCPQWEKDAARMLAQMPKADREVLMEGNRTGKTETPAYQAAVQNYYHQHICRLKDWPKDLSDSFAGMGQQVYGTMNGPNEFTTTGTLKGYDSTARLKQIHLPTLIICGEFDEATPVAGRLYQKAMPGSRLVVLKGRSHLANLEDPKDYNRVLREFLRGR